MFKAIILDFDGVILESLDIKTRAFLKVYHDYPEYADEIARYHLQNGGVSRYKKFVHINNNIIGIPITDSEIEEMAKTFSEAVVDEMLKCPFVDGALEFLDKYSVIAGLYVASGTPQDELRLIVQKRGLTKYFSGVFGTPASKPQIIQEILAIDSIRNDEAVFVGDDICGGVFGVGQTGMKAILFTNQDPLKYLGKIDKIEIKNNKPDAAVGGVGGLPEVLREKTFNFMEAD